MLNGGDRDLRVRSGGGPKMLRSISAPGAPALGSGKDLAGARPPTAGVSQSARNRAVDSGGRIGLAQLPLRDVARRLIVQTANGAQFLDRVVNPAACAKELGVDDKFAGDCLQSGRSAGRHAELR